MPFVAQQIQTLSPQGYEFARDVSEIYLGEDVITVASAAAPPEFATPLQRKDTTYAMALGINTTVPNPINPRRGMKVTYIFAATGVFTVTWGAAFKFTANGAAAAAQYAATTFVYNGAFWVQEAGALTYK